MEAEIVYNDSADLFMQLGILPRQGSRQERAMQALYRVRRPLAAAPARMTRVRGGGR